MCIASLIKRILNKMSGITEPVVIPEAGDPQLDPPASKLPTFEKVSRIPAQSLWVDRDAATHMAVEVLPPCKKTVPEVLEGVKRIFGPPIAVVGETFKSHFRTEAEVGLVNPVFQSVAGDSEVATVGSRLVLRCRGSSVAIRIPVLARSTTREVLHCLQQVPDGTLQWVTIEEPPEGCFYTADDSDACPYVVRQSTFDALPVAYRPWFSRPLEKPTESESPPSLTLSLADQVIDRDPAVVWGTRTLAALSQGSSGAPVQYPVGHFHNRWPLAFSLTYDSDTYTLRLVQTDRAARGNTLRLVADPPRLVIESPHIPCEVYLELVSKKPGKAEVWRFTFVTAPSVLPAEVTNAIGTWLGVCGVDIGTSMHCVSLVHEPRFGEYEFDNASAARLRQPSVVVVDSENSPTLSWNCVPRLAGEQADPIGSKMLEYRSLKSAIHRGEAALCDQLPGFSAQELLAASVRRLLASAEAEYGMRLTQLHFSCPPWYWTAPTQRPMEGFEDLVHAVIEPEDKRSSPPVFQRARYRETAPGCLAQRDLRCGFVATAMFRRRCDRACEKRDELNAKLNDSGFDQLSVHIATDEATSPIYRILHDSAKLFLATGGSTTKDDTGPIASPRTGWIVVIDAGAGTTDVALAFAECFPDGTSKLRGIWSQTAHLSLDDGRPWFPGGDAIDAWLAHWILDEGGKLVGSERLKLCVEANGTTLYGPHEFELGSDTNETLERIRVDYPSRPLRGVGGTSRVILEHAENAKCVLLQHHDTVGLVLSLRSLGSTTARKDLHVADFLKGVARLPYVVAATLAKLSEEATKAMTQSEAVRTGVPFELVLCGRAIHPWLHDAVKSIMEGPATMSLDHAGVSRDHAAWWTSLVAKPASPTIGDRKGYVALGTIAEFLGKQIEERYGIVGDLRITLKGKGTTEIPLTRSTTCGLARGEKVFEVRNELNLGTLPKARLEGWQNPGRVVTLPLRRIPPLPAPEAEMIIEKGDWEFSEENGSVVARRHQ